MSQGSRSKLILALDKVTENIENYIMSFGLMAISAIVFINVIARYFFATSFSWSEELSRNIVIWITFLGVSSCARYDTHVKVDLLPNMLKGKGKKYHEVLVNSLMVLLSAYMAYISFSFMMVQYRGGNTSVAIAIPIWTIYLSTVVGFTFCVYVYARRVWNTLRERSGDTQIDGGYGSMQQKDVSEL